MKLSFDNPCRSFDEHGGRICFWGYDSAIEVSFYLPVEAMSRLCPKMERDEAGVLKAFDTMLTHIHHAAEKVYQHGATAYILTAKDLGAISNMTLVNKK